MSWSRATNSLLASCGGHGQGTYFRGPRDFPFMPCGMAFHPWETMRTGFFIRQCVVGGCYGALRYASKLQYRGPPTTTIHGAPRVQMNFLVPPLLCIFIARHLRYTVPLVLSSFYFKYNFGIFFNKS